MYTMNVDLFLEWLQDSGYKIDEDYSVTEDSNYINITTFFTESLVWFRFNIDGSLDLIG